MNNRLKRILLILTLVLYCIAAIGTFTPAEAAGETVPGINVDVASVDGNQASFHVDQVHTWIIRSEVPPDMEKAEKYIISDIIDYRLTYQSCSPIVKIYTKSGEEKVVDPGIHYKLSEGLASMDGKTADCISITLTAAGRKYVTENLGSGKEHPELRVYFKAAINSKASPGVGIPNQAILEYTDASGGMVQADSDIAQVFTGGIHILKLDEYGNPQQGKVLRITQDRLDREEGNVAYEEFYTTPDFARETANRVTTDAEGRAEIYGLAWGTYYVVEEAESGEHAVAFPVKIDRNSHLEAYTTKLGSTASGLPDTGDVIIRHIAATVTTTVLSAIMLIIMNHKKKV